MIYLELFLSSGFEFHYFTSIFLLFAGICFGLATGSKMESIVRLIVGDYDEDDFEKEKGKLYKAAKVLMKNSNAKDEAAIKEITDRMIYNDSGKVVEIMNKVQAKVFRDVSVLFLYAGFYAVIMAIGCSLDTRFAQSVELYNFYKNTLLGINGVFIATYIYIFYALYLNKIEQKQSLSLFLEHLLMVPLLMIISFSFAYFSHSLVSYNTIMLWSIIAIMTPFCIAFSWIITVLKSAKAKI